MLLFCKAGGNPFRKEYLLWNVFCFIYVYMYIDTSTQKGKKSVMLSQAFWYEIVTGKENHLHQTNTAAVFKSQTLSSSKQWQQQNAVDMMGHELELLTILASSLFYRNSAKMTLHSVREVLQLVWKSIK